jgi:hypothetical protein
MQTSRLSVVIGYFLLLGMPVGAAPSGPATDLALDIPAGWSTVGDSTAFPIQVVHENGDAEFLIFRTDLARDESVSGREELKLSVQRIIDSVIMPLPQAQLISSTGYDETERAQFALEFRSGTPGDRLRLQHRLVGYLYRAEDNHQILFTLWGRGLASSFADRHDAIVAMQNSFKFVGPHEAVVFAKEMRKWVLVALMLVAAIGIGLYTRKLSSSAHKSPDVSERWRCGCGHRNVPSLSQCSACGKLRSVPVETN